MKNYTGSYIQTTIKKISLYPTNRTHIAETGIAMNNAGSILASGNLARPPMLKPVEKRMSPPTAEKSSIITGVVSGKIMVAA